MTTKELLYNHLDEMSREHIYELLYDFAKENLELKEEVENLRWDLELLHEDIQVMWEDEYLCEE